MKHYLGILLLFSLLAPFAASFALLQYEREQVRESVKRNLISGLKREELRLLQFTREEAERELRWEHAGEFEYQGQWYDVAERSEKGDTLYFWCWWDHEETLISQQLSRLVARALGQDPQQRENAHRLSAFLFSLFLPESGPPCATPPSTPLIRPEKPLARLFNRCFPPPLPPPKPQAPLPV